MCALHALCVSLCRKTFLLALKGSLKGPQTCFKTESNRLCYHWGNASNKTRLIGVLQRKRGRSNTSQGCSADAREELWFQQLSWTVRIRKDLFDATKLRSMLPTPVKFAGGLCIDVCGVLAYLGPLLSKTLNRAVLIYKYYIVRRIEH